jgi:solute carrier family 25 2-oxodicarboxylate transporter 21
VKSGVVVDALRKMIFNILCVLLALLLLSAARGVLPPPVLRNRGGAVVQKDKAGRSDVIPVLFAAFSAAAVMYPVDLVRALAMANSGSGTKLTTTQLLSNFRRAHGVQGFFTQGLVPELARSTWMRFIKFSLFPVVHMTLHGIPEVAGTGLQKAAAAIVAAIPEAISIMPFEVAKISLQLDTGNKFKNNMFRAMNAVWKEKGFAGISMGYAGVQYRQAAWSAGYFASIRFFEKHVNTGMELFGLSDNPVIGQLLSGFLAGVFGAAINTPGDTIRTVLQKRILAVPGAISADAPTLISVGREILQTRGPAALYSGFGFKAVHLGGGGALMAFLIPLFRKTLSPPVPVKTNKRG